MEYSTDQRISLNIYLQAFDTYVIDNLGFVAQIQTDLNRWRPYRMREMRLQLDIVLLLLT